MGPRELPDAREQAGGSSAAFAGAPAATADAADAAAAAIDDAGAAHPAELEATAPLAPKAGFRAGFVGVVGSFMGGGDKEPARGRGSGGRDAIGRSGTGGRSGEASGTR